MPGWPIRKRRPRPRRCTGPKTWSAAARCPSTTGSSSTLPPRSLVNPPVDGDAVDPDPPSRQVLRPRPDASGCEWNGPPVDGAVRRRRARRSGQAPLGANAVIVISHHYASRLREELKTTAWDLVVIDEAHKLRNAYRPSNKVGQGVRWAFTVALAGPPHLRHGLHFVPKQGVLQSSRQALVKQDTHASTGRPSPVPER